MSPRHFGPIAINRHSYGGDQAFETRLVPDTMIQTITTGVINHTQLLERIKIT